MLRSFPFIEVRQHGTAVAECTNQNTRNYTTQQLATDPTVNHVPTHAPVTELYKTGAPSFVPHTKTDPPLSGASTQETYQLTTHSYTRMPTMHSTSVHEYVSGGIAKL